MYLSVGLCSLLIYIIQCTVCTDAFIVDGNKDNPTNVAKKCTLPSAPSHGTINVLIGGSDTTLDPGSIIQYSCNTGFTLSGSKSQICNTDGVWAGSAPVCQGSSETSSPTCPRLQDPANGSIKYLQTTITAGSVTITQCSSGHVLRGTATRICQASGSWTGSTVFCVPYCTALSNPLNGTATPSHSVGNDLEVTTFTCQTGFKLTGSASTTCSKPDQWSNPSPTCVKEAQCPNLTIEHGSVRIIGTLAVYICDYGYTRLGAPTRSCTNSVWASIAPSCVKECKPLENPLHGSVDVNSTTVGSMGRFTCEAGYTLHGAIERTCQADGHWSGAPPTCELGKSCGRATSIDYGTFTSTGTTQGSITNYKCYTGFTMVGVHTRICTTDGSWSGTPPRCAKDCGSVSEPANGHVGNHGTSVNNTATFSCNQGYTLTGSSTITCLTSGLWSGNQPSCVKVDCHTPPQVSHCHVTLQSGTHIGATASYKCDSGYAMTSGDSVRLCLNSGQWSGIQPVCGLITTFTTTTTTTTAKATTDTQKPTSTLQTTTPLKTTPKLTTTTLIPTTTRPIPTTSTTKLTTTRPIPTTTRPIPTTTRHIPKTTRHIPTTTRSIPTTSTSKPTTTRPIPTTSTSKPTTTRPIPTTTRPIPTTTRPIPTTSTSQPSTSTIQAMTTNTKLQCRSCERVRSLDQCMRLIQCNQGEHCYLDHILNNVTRESVYTGGCRQKEKCHARGRRSDHMACSECCNDTNAALGCNSHLCSIPTVVAPAGIQCIYCDSPVMDISTCNSIKTCAADEMCLSKTVVTDTNQVLQQPGCFNKHVCVALFNTLVSKKKREVPDSIRKRNAPKCNMCCGDDGCNVKTCEDLQSHMASLYQHNKLDISTLKET